MMTLWPSIIDDWGWNPAAGYVAFEVLGTDDQTGDSKHIFVVHVTEGYLKATYGIPDHSDALAVAKNNAKVIGDLAMEKAFRGLVGAENVILIDG